MRWNWLRIQYFRTLITVRKEWFEMFIGEMEIKRDCFFAEVGKIVTFMDPFF